jgi:sulfur carrier protein ThiS
VVSVHVRGVLVLLTAISAVVSGCGGSKTTTVTETERVSTQSGGSATTSTFIVDVLGQRSEQPSEFAFSVNGDLVARQLRWHGWGSPTATARATFVFNAAPHTSATTVNGKVVATAIERCRAASYYTTTRLEFDERPPFQPQVPRLGTPCD